MFHRYKIALSFCLSSLYLILTLDFPFWNHFCCMLWPWGISRVTQGLWLRLARIQYPELSSGDLLDNSIRVFGCCSLFISNRHHYKNHLRPRLLGSYLCQPHGTSLLKKEMNIKVNRWTPQPLISEFCIFIKSTSLDLIQQEIMMNLIALMPEQMHSLQYVK